MSNVTGNDAEPGRRLVGEVAIITGGNGGLGAAAATLFAKEGARVAVHYSGQNDASAARAAEVVKRLQGFGAEAMLSSLQTCSHRRSPHAKPAAYSSPPPPY